MNIEPLFVLPYLLSPFFFFFFFFFFFAKHRGETGSSRSERAIRLSKKGLGCNGVAAELKETLVIIVQKGRGDRTGREGATGRRKGQAGRSANRGKQFS